LPKIPLITGEISIFQKQVHLLMAFRWPCGKKKVLCGNHEITLQLGLFF